MSRYINAEAANAAFESGTDPNSGNFNAANFGIQAPPKAEMSSSQKAAQIAGSIGFLVGVVYAFKTKSGFWKGWGYGIIGSVALGGVGYGVGTLLKKKPVDRGIIF